MAIIVMSCDFGYSSMDSEHDSGWIHQCLKEKSLYKRKEAELPVLTRLVSFLLSGSANFSPSLLALQNRIVFPVLDT